MECLTRSTINALAAGRGQIDDLAAAGRHLAQCGRCRSAVAAAASGVPGPGETVVLLRADQKGHTVLKYAVVLLSVVVVGTIWRYGATNPGAAAQADARRSSASLESEAVARVKEDIAALRELPAPSPSVTRPAPVEPTVAHDVASPAPVISLVTEPDLGAPATKPTLGSPPEKRAVAAVVPRTKRRPHRRPHRVRNGSVGSSRSAAVASHPPNVAERAGQDEELDFGIDEPQAAPVPQRARKRAIRTTLE